jgi:PqqD family protein of HPr-rel-A system
MARLKPKIRDGLEVVELDGEAVVYDEDRANLHHLNQTATLVFSLCDGTATVAELAADLSEGFGVPADEIEQQIRSLLRKFRRMELLERTNGSPKKGRSPA